MALPPRPDLRPGPAAPRRRLGLFFFTAIGLIVLSLVLSVVLAAVSPPDNPDTGGPLDPLAALTFVGAFMLWRWWRKGRPPPSPMP
jgi:hypothetical protein